MIELIGAALREIIQIPVRSNLKTVTVTSYPIGTFGVQLNKVNTIYKLIKSFFLCDHH